MQIAQLKVQFRDRLRDEFPETEIESFFYILTEYYLGLRRIDIAMNPEHELSEVQMTTFEKAILRLKDHEPVQYIIGKTEFYGLEFYVNKNVLIPRPETEELVEWIISDHSDHKEINRKLKILDIGTGSGCIPISLAKNIPDSEVSSYDISSEALSLARQNADLNDAEVNFHKVDILNLDRLKDNFDIIVSNPPYVRELEKQEMHKNVLKYEPALALYVANNDALIFYKKIGELAYESLREHGALYFEINQYLARETKAIIEDLGFEAELKKDIFGKYRMLKAKRKIYE
ncbi:peptide chain release factor N(5)-glutamine methyltransferase [Christiangramia sabulilitoris]|uniref:Release factor glutamine methyltransferase n=1 Tax=Christiangramia sabulilitoris TaxID=2583991 RepID=A0A550I7Q9_9FLAO|nr:peptide chain release factor N(5)-glutamine methyltransferase [Christiangramia sabulilitoris]TRO67014.1 peptide chain release factor N(5)-glutamine methyltransferase [Christiangramia sabulilitoris]